MYKLSVVILLGAVGVAYADKKPNVAVKTASIKGALDGKALTAPVKAAKSKLIGCYAQASSDGGNATPSVTIGADGAVSIVSVPDVTEDSIKWCLALALSNLRFPSTDDGMPVEVTYQLRIDHAGSVGSGGAFAALTGSGDIDDANIYGGLLGNPDYPPSVGFGTGTSKSKGPSVALGQSGVTGDLDKAIIRRYIKRNIQKIQYCYEKELLAKPKLEGTVTVEFDIAPDGKVTSSVAHGMDTAVEGCVAQVIKGIEFPKPKGGGIVAVKYPFTFVAAGSKQP
jgi:hypothetical protein